MDNLSLLIRLHEDAERQGPGSEMTTLMALGMTELPKSQHIRILDIGCGTGAQTLTLAEHTNSTIVAVDLHQEFLCRLQSRAIEKGLASRIHAVQCSMEHLSVVDCGFDLIWSEGAIYNIGFENGLRQWKNKLRPKGFLAISELTWLTGSRPREVEEYWTREYNGIATVADKLKIAEQSGYRYVGSFTLPKFCWIDTYYGPMKERFARYLAENDSDEARYLIKNERTEMQMYQNYSDDYGYVFYILQNEE